MWQSQVHYFVCIYALYRHPKCIKGTQVLSGPGISTTANLSFYLTL